MSKGKYYFSKSLEKGLKILALFSRNTPVLSQSEIARTLGLNMTSTYRYINTLVELGYLEKDRRTKAIQPSIHCLLFCTNLMRATDHMRLVKGVVDRIHGRHNISIEVVLIVDDVIMRIYHREAEETLTYNLPDHSRNCLHNTALGKAYLSSLPEERMMEKTASLALRARTDKTLVDREKLISELRTARENQYATSSEEYLPGLIAIGAPLVDPVSGESVGAVSFDFSVLEHRVEEIRDRYADMIRETARSLSDILPAGNHRQ